MERNIRHIHIIALLIIGSIGATPQANDAGVGIPYRPDFTNTDPISRQERLAEKERNEGYVNLISDLLSEATSHIGTRYRRGGKTPKGFDCSGFTGYVFNKIGYRLGASSREQFARDGYKVADDDVRPGDLLFFRGRAKGSVGHVGIAISADHSTGDIIFIHSATSGGIRIDHTSAPYYRSRYLGARRVISNNI